MTRLATDIVHDDTTDEHQEPYRGPWWGFPPLRNALISGLVFAATFVSERIGIIPVGVAIGLYVVAALLGAAG